MNIRQKRNSLLFKNVVINLSIVVILILSIVSILYIISSKIITEEVEQQIHLTLTGAKKDIEYTRRSQEQQLTILSKSTEAIEVLEGGDKAAFANQASGLAEEYSKYLENVMLLNKNGKVVYDSNNNALAGIDLSAYDYFRKSMKGNIEHSEVLESKSTGNLIEVVSVPVKKDGKVIGVLATSMDMDYIKEILQEIKIGKSGYAFLIDDKGNFVYHPDEKLMNTNITEVGVKELTDALPDMLAGKESAVYYTYGGVKKMDLFMPVESWSISVNVVKSEYLSSVNTMLKMILLIGFVMLILGALASTVNSYLMVRRVKKVQKVMGVATHGDMTVQVEEPRLRKCWELNHCDKTDCPGYDNENLKCWEISGTLCDGELQTDTLSKLEKCKKCNVYKLSEGDEIGQMARSLSIMIKTIWNLVYHISQMSEQLLSSSQELSSASEETTTSAESISERMEVMSAGAQNQTEHVGNINSMAHDMNLKLTDSVTRMNRMAKEAGIVNQKARVGEDKIGYAIHGMEQIKIQTGKIVEVMNELILQSAKIGEINNMITAISEETNLLALNASIEAARAGEHGRGFGVVADEIGKLASQSQESAKGISALIEDIKESIDSASRLMHTETELVQNGIQSVQQSRDAFEEIATTVYELANEMKKVAAFVIKVQESSVSVTDAVEKMTVIIEESGADMEEITSSAEEQTSVSEEISKSATELAKMAEELMQTVSQFKV